MPFKGGRKGCYYLESQSRMGGGLCDNHPEANTVDSALSPHSLGPAPGGFPTAMLLLQTG